MTLILCAGQNSSLQQILSPLADIHLCSATIEEDIAGLPSAAHAVIFDFSGIGKSGVSGGEIRRRIGRLNQFREALPMLGVPCWAVLSRHEFTLNSLLLSLGCDEVLLAGELPRALSSLGKTPGEISSGNRRGSSHAENSSIDYLASRLNHSSEGRKLVLNCSSVDSLNEIAGQILSSLFKSFAPHLALVLLNDNQRVVSFVLPDNLIYREDFDDFLNFCLNDFYSFFPGLNLEDIHETLFLGARSDFEKISLEPHKMSSYLYLPIRDGNGSVTATIHLGHLRNGYFTARMTAIIREMIDAVAGRFNYRLELEQTGNRQEKLLNIFARFVPEEIIPELILQESKKDSAQAERREITVLFSDIRSFTTITEKNSAQTVVDFLNRHFEVMVSIIKEHGGFIDKFIGDAIVAIFMGDEADGAVSAVKAAVKMCRHLPDVDCSGMTLDGSHYSIGIGIHSGPAIVGNIGSEEKLDYTAVGEVTGIAEELEASTKRYPSRILVSGNSAVLAGNSAQLKLLDTLELGNQGSTDAFAPMEELVDD